MQNRTVIEKVIPLLEGGLYRIKREVGEEVKVHAHILCDGHDAIRASLLFRNKGSKNWKETFMHHKGNDEWIGSFQADVPGIMEFTVVSWADEALDWFEGTRKKIQAGEQVATEMLMGADLLERIAKNHKGKTQKNILAQATFLRTEKDQEKKNHLLLSDVLANLIEQYPLKEHVTRLPHIQEIQVFPAGHHFTTWYEFFPRSTSGKSHVHGTFKHCEKVIDTVADMGFDVVYFPPIHPIGESSRKGKNNSTKALSGDPGSPWAIGAKEGGHKSIHHELGSIEDFEKLVAHAAKKGIRIALDIAFQASPDHPWVKEHPDWFKWRPNGTVQYAENPPKKYQDVLPFHFTCDDWKGLYKELTSVFLFWASKGVRIFRVDNPHTKPFAFWEYALAEVNKKYPDAIFLSEAFTRPKIMNRLARIGFTQSYTYFTWRTSKQEIQEYMLELTGSEAREYFRPNFWPNTPDILPYDLQNQGEKACAIRYVLAATLSSSIGIYGPVFDLLITEPYPGKEEYNHSEKYEIKAWDYFTRTPFRKFIKKINEIRKMHPALQNTYNIRFVENDNPRLLSFIKQSGSDCLLVIINLDQYHKQSGFCHFPANPSGGKPRQVMLTDVIDGSQYTWSKEWNYVELNPEKQVCHIFSIEI
jgi:starch synthase (maltosyl-transferring)